MATLVLLREPLHQDQQVLAVLIRAGPPAASQKGGGGAE
jgi:hypothetical protein